MIRSNYTEEDFRVAADGICPGPDLEWFGVDRDGHVAGFTNAGFAVVPKRVFDSFARFNMTLDAICLLPRKGVATWIAPKPTRIETWDDWASHGLFAYDWNHGIGRPDVTLSYRLMCKPSAAISLSQLPGDVAEYVSRVRFDTVRFQDAVEILVSE